MSFLGQDASPPPRLFTPFPGNYLLHVYLLVEDRPLALPLKIHRHTFFTPIPHPTRSRGLVTTLIALGASISPP